MPFTDIATRSLLRWMHSSAQRIGSMIVAVVLLMALLPAPPVAAQVPLVPDAITTPDLQPIIKTIGLSDQQALSLLPIHDAYKERYRHFLDTEVKELQDELIEIGLRFTRGAFEIPERRELENLLLKFKRLLDKSRNLDRQFFVEVGGMLAEEQMPLLERARINRELKVFRQILGGVGEMNRGASVNIAEIVRGLDISPQAREQIEPMLSEYESSLLSKSNTIYNVLIEAAEALLDFIDESGVRSMTLEEMAAMAQNPPPGLLQRAESTFDLASKPIQEAAYDVSQLNMRTYRRVAPLMEDEPARALRDRYFRRAFREVYDGDALWEARFRTAMRMEELSEEQKSTLQEQLEAFTQRHDAAVDSGVAALEASRQYKTFKQFSRQEPDPAKDKVDAAVERRKGVEEQAMVALNSLLGDDLVAALDERMKQQREEESNERQGVRVAARARVSGGAPGDAQGGPRGEVQVEVRESTNDDPFAAFDSDTPSRYLPPAITSAQFDSMLNAAALQEGDRAVAATLFEAYRADYDALRSSELTIQAKGDEPTPAETSKAGAERQAELAELDRRLFEDLTLIAGEDGPRELLQRLHAARQRQAAADASRALAFAFGDEEAYIDLLSMVLVSDIDAASRQSALGELQDYEAQAAIVVEQRLEEAREVQRRTDSMQRANRVARRRGDGGPFGGGSRNQAVQFAMEKWQEARRALGQTNRKLVDLNRASLDRLLAALPQEAAWQIRLAYNQAAFPDIFRDSRSAERTIQGALDLPDLNDGQRSRINEVAAQYRADFYALCDQMVGLRQARDFNLLGGQMPEKDDINREIELEKLRWNRNELSARARLQLSLILTDDQARSLPELQAR